jgi:hypothetical protein
MCESVGTEHRRGQLNHPVETGVWRGTKYVEKTFRNVIWVALCFNASLRVEMPASNRPKYSMVLSSRRNSSPSPSHEVMSVNDLFRPHDCIHPVVSLTVVQVFVFR